MRKVFAFEEFIKDLKEDALARLEYVAMVKMDEEKNNLLIAVGIGCERWIPLPAEIVEHIEYLDTIPCKDHTHELVRLILKIPKEENPVAMLFGELLFQQRKLAVTSDLLPIGRCLPGIIEPCKQYPDGIYREEFQYADCETAIRLCGSSVPPRSPQPSISVTAGLGAFYISGEGFARSSTVNVIYNYFNGSGVTTNNDSPSVNNVDSSGNFSTIISVSTLLNNGQLDVRATDTSGLSATKSVEVRLT